MAYFYNAALRFANVVEQHADKDALVYHDRENVTYRELDELSNQMAGLLQHKYAIAKGQVVAIFNNKSPRAFASMLACLKIGATYCNLDLTSPQERLSKIIDRCRPALLINDVANSDKISAIANEYRIQLCYLHAKELDKNLLNLETKTDHATVLSGNHPAYIMFTSGSTGFPKGAVMSHQNVINLADWAQQTFTIDSNDILTNVNPVYFDNSVFDFYGALLNGAGLAPFQQAIVNHPQQLVEKIDEVGCTLWFSVPSMLVYLLTTKALNKDNMKSITRFAFGGEGFPKPQLKKLFDLYRDRAELINVYGPTECTCICSSYPISEQDFEDMKNLAPLGRIAPNFDFEIRPLDEGNLRLGELCLKGPNVGMGYYNDPERTEKVFVQNPFNPHFKEGIYRTGDLVELDEEGLLHFKGRVDNQIKHMGYRIELEEIEAALNVLDDVQEAGVIYKKLGPGMGQIMAFIAADDRIDPQNVETDLKNLLPPYMMPKKIKILEVLPKNRNGKINRKALADL